MNRARLEALLAAVARGEESVESAAEALRRLPFETLPEATIDHHRQLRCGFPEVVFAAGKTEGQIRQIARIILDRGQTLLMTRVSPEMVQPLQASLGPLDHNELARTLSRAGSDTAPPCGSIGIVAAGTADLPVAEEAAVTAGVMGASVERIYDVGVAGLHRLLARLDLLHRQRALVVVAGMEGALPSVVGGLVSVPVIAVPTSVGYGASFGGLAALLGMLNSCAAGVTVVNIDNGFGAGYAAALIARGPQAAGPDQDATGDPQ